MSDNYIDYSNAETIFGTYATAINKIKATPITYAAYQQLSAEQKAANRYLITDYPDEGDSYSNLTNKPRINNITLAGNKSAHDLGLVAEESGKGLSSNDYTTAEKTKLAGLENYDDTQLAGRVSDIEGLIPNDATTLNKLATADDIPDTTNFIEKSVTTGLVKNDGTIDTNTYAQSSDLGTAAGKDYTDRVSPGNRNLVESQSVYSAIQSALSSIYTPRGDLTCAELTSALLIAENVGDVYEMTDAGTTSALFLQGAGETIPVGANVGIINAGEGRILFNLMPGAFDLTDYQKKELDDPLTIGGVSRTEVEPALGALNTAKADKSEMSVTAGTGADADKTVIQLKSGTTATVLHAHQDISGKVDKSATAGLLKNDGTVDTNTYMTASDIAGKADKSEMSIVDGSGASADKTTITLKSGTSATVLKEHQDISGKAEKSEMSVTPGTGDNADKATIQLKEGTSATVLTAHQDLSGKVDKVSGATNGNFAGLNASGEVVDSGKKASDFATPSDIQDVYEVMGNNGAKNLIPYPYDIDAHMEYDGVVWDTVEEGVVTVTGQLQTASTTTYHIMARSNSGFRKSGTYILTGCPAGGSNTTYRMQAGYTDSGGTWHNLAVEYGDGATFTYDYDAVQADLAIRCQILSASYVANNLTFHPMLRLAADPDDTWTPYAETNRQLTDDSRAYRENINVLGAKNLLLFNTSHIRKINAGGTWSNNAYTYNGITYTLNNDGSVLVNGTASDYSIFRMVDNSSIKFNLDSNKTYYYSGTPSSGSSFSTYYSYYSEYIGSSWTYNIDYGSGVLVTPDASATQIVVDIVVKSGQSVSNQTFKPMLRLASDSDPTYVPYAPTNAKLNEEKMSYADNGVLGAKNILKNNITSGTRNGVTYTANSDGTFTANGTATANGGIELNVNIDGSLIEGMRYKVSLDGVGADKEGTQNGIMLYIAKYLNGVNVGDVARSNKTGGFTDEFVYHKDSSFDNLRVGCYTFKNASFTNSTLKPMIRLASDPDDTYQPYAMTNRELTEGAGLPKKTLIRTLANGKITVTIPKNLGSSYTQGSLKLIGSNADSEAHVTFCLNADNTAVSVSKLTNLGSKALTLDSASISGNNLVLEISGVQDYAWASAEYFMSLSAGASAIQPTWTFAGS